jgi:hypothetical protein
VEALQIVVNAAVVGAVGIILATMTHGLRREIGGIRGEMGELRAELTGQIGGVRGEMGELRREFKGDIGELRAELKGDIGELRLEMREMRSDLTRVALAVGAEPRAGNR